jgi:photosystem II stability/assembly factor-like uncharacterized protein
MQDSIRLYAATYDGISVLHPTGAGWAEVGTLPRVESESIAGARRHPERVYVADMNGGLYGTEDAGVHWTKLLDGEVWSVAVDPSDDDVVYAGTAPVHLYRSPDRGKSWEDLTGLQELPEEVRQNWRYPPPPHRAHVYYIALDPAQPRTIYACLEHGGIVRSFDGGETWEDVSQGIDYPDIHCFGILGGARPRYFASAARGFYASDDPATGWTRAENGCTRDYFHSFVFLAPERAGEPPTMLLATADKSPGSWDRPAEARGAIFRSQDGAESWHWVGEGLAPEMRQAVNMLVNHPTERDAALAALGIWRRGVNPTGTIMVTHDRGTNWEPLPIELPPVIGLWATTD